MMNEIKGRLNKWRSIPCSWIGRLNTVKMPVLPILICRWCNPSQNPSKFFGGYWQTDSTFVQRQKAQNTNTILRKTKLEDWCCSLRLTIKATIIKIVRYCKRRDTYNRNRRPIQIYSIDPWQRSKVKTMEQYTLFN